MTLSNNWMSFAFHNYQAELFPTRVRARAVGFVYGWSRVSAAFAGLLIGFFLQEGGATAVALFIAAAMAIMTVTIGGFGPKTTSLGSRKSRTDVNDTGKGRQRRYSSRARNRPSDG